MGAGRLISALPADLFLTVVDVGSAGGLHKRWRAFQPVLSAVLFEPREGGVAAGKLGRGESRTYPIALSDRNGEANLYITALANMSSFLEPEAQVFGRYRKKGADTRVTDIQKVPIDRLDALAQADGFRPDVLKIDTQGSELQVLKGAEQSLPSVLLAEIEVSFFRRYVGQPLFAEIEAFMTERGFELIEIHRLKRYRAANSLGIVLSLVRGSQWSGRIAYADAIFIRSEEAVLASARNDGGASLLKAMIALLAYGKADHAAALFDAGANLLPPATAEAVRNALRSLNRTGAVPSLIALLRHG